MTSNDNSPTTRREFVRRETEALGRFLEPAGSHLVGWVRSYRCDCGFKCHAAGDIYDHAQQCEHPKHLGEGTQ